MGEWESVYRLRQSGLHWRDVGEEIVVLNTTSAEYLAVNQSGHALWPLLSSGARRDDLEQRLILEFGIPPDSASRDVELFLAALDRLSLLEPPG